VDHFHFHIKLTDKWKGSIAWYPSGHLPIIYWFPNLLPTQGWLLCVDIISYAFQNRVDFVCFSSSNWANVESQLGSFEVRRKVHRTVPHLIKYSGNHLQFLYCLFFVLHKFRFKFCKWRKILLKCKNEYILFEIEKK